MTAYKNFNWIGIHLSGQKQSGTISAKSKLEAKNKLSGQNITLLSLKSDRINLVNKKFSIKDRLDFTQQLYLLLRAGISLTKAFDIIIFATNNKLHKNIFININDHITAGQSLSAALSAFPHYFNAIYCKLIHAGEQSGTLDIILQQLIAHEAQTEQVKQKILKALFYPLSVLVIAVLITIGLLLFVMPQFSAIYSSFGAQLPLLTQLIISLSIFLKHNGFYLLLILLLLIFLVQFLLKDSLFLSYLALKIPGIKQLIIIQHTAKWCEVCAILLKAGLPLLETMLIANQTVGNATFQQSLARAFLKIKSGLSLHGALNEVDLLPLRAKQLIEIGEKQHQVDLVLFNRRLRCLVIIDLKTRQTDARRHRANAALHGLRQRTLANGGGKPADWFDSVRPK